MASEYKFRGTADMSAHDKALQKSANEVRKYKQETEKSKKEVQAFANNVKGKALSGLNAFAGALGIAYGAAETFEKIIRSSQGTSDAWDRTIRAATTSTNTFFTALSTGDFTSFSLGLDGIISKAKDTAAALDALGNARISYDYFTAKNSAALRQQLVIAKDKTNSKEDRAAATALANQIIDKQSEYTKSKGNSLINAIQSLVTEKNLLNGASITQADIDRILELDLLSNGAQRKKWNQQEYNLYLASAANIKRQFGRNDPQRAAALKELTESYKMAVLYNELLVKMSDDELKNITALSIEYDNNNRALSEMQTQMLELTNQSAGMREAFVGSIAEIEKRISDLQIEYKYTTNAESRAALQKEINELKNQKILMEVVFQPRQQILAGSQPVAASPLPEKLPEIPLVQLSDTATGFDDITEAAELATGAIGGFANMFSTLGSITEDTKHAWAAYLGAFLQGISQIIPQLIKLAAVEQSEAMSSTIAQSSKTPWPATIPAIMAAVGTVGGLIASIPKYANGGIIQGAASIGDFNIARVNNGEMILNGTQQAKLFRLINDGSIGNGGFAKDVQFRISGNDLVGVFNNVNKKNRRVS